MPNLSRSALDGFWLPKGVREKLLSPETEYITCSYANGRPCEPNAEGAVTARWPRFREEQWKTLLAALKENRQRAPAGQEYWDRLQTALKETGSRFSDPSDPLCNQLLTALPGYTGYSEPMIRLTVGALGMFALDKLPVAFSLFFTKRVARGWQPMPGLAGRLRFYPHRRRRSGIMRRIPRLRKAPTLTRGSLFRKTIPSDMVVGYGAGNIPGTALLIAFLSQGITLAVGSVPVVVVKNSRSEPIFSPLVLSALEEADPELMLAVAVLVWDNEDAYVQDFLTGHADLIIAAASDETIAQIRSQIDRSMEEHNRVSSRPIRFHAHGHKVSFSAIGKEMLAEESTTAVESTATLKSSIVEVLANQAGGQSLLDVVTLLAALDSIFWDQHGCLSSRVHFVEVGGEGYYTPMEYAKRLEEQLRLLADFLPRGAWPLQQLHDRFDRYKHLEMTGKVRVISQYGDEWLVILDQRRLSPTAFRNLVNDCQGRVIVVRPVSDLMEIPNQYLRMLPGENLQSLSVAVGRVGEGLTDSFLHFAEMCGACGVTAIRTIGRGAFPQLAYSWDGYLPLDLVRQRPRGHFTTIEFDTPMEQILDTYQALQALH